MKYIKRFEDYNFEERDKVGKVIDMNDYIIFLKRHDFNEKQIKFLVQQRENYLNLSEDESFDEDAYERDMWYTMNQSGLFDTEEEFGSNWSPEDTRFYITQYDN